MSECQRKDMAIWVCTWQRKEIVFAIQSLRLFAEQIDAIGSCDALLQFIGQEVSSTISCRLKAQTANPRSLPCNVEQISELIFVDSRLQRTYQGNVKSRLSNVFKSFEFDVR